MEDLILFFAKFVGLLITFMVLAMMIEMSLSQVFESKLFKLLERKIDNWGDWLDLKPWISVYICYLVTTSLVVDFFASFGSVTGLFITESSPISIFLKALFLAGG